MALSGVAYRAIRGFRKMDEVDHEMFSYGIFSNIAQWCAAKVFFSNKGIRQQSLSTFLFVIYSDKLPCLIRKMLRKGAGMD